MVDIYYWFGFIVFWACVTIGVSIIAGYLYKKLLDELGKRFKSVWILFEFAYYKKDFKEWVKDKERIVK